MLSKSQAKTFFLLGTLLCVAFFIFLTIDTVQRVPKQTKQTAIDEQVIRGKELWDKNNCMGCHTLLGEGAYYAPELTKVYERRGPAWMKMFIKDPQAMYPGERKMVKYDFNDGEIEDLIAFFKWIGEMDLNGFPPKPNISTSANSYTSKDVSNHQSAIKDLPKAPAIFSQICISCHAVSGQGANVGPALDGVGSRRESEYLKKWLKDPQSLKPGTAMPKLPLAEKDIEELVQYLSALK